jgi:hypothetical protein
MSAIFSPGPRPLWRYRLDRAICDNYSRVCCSLLTNPSKAGAVEDDATSRRMVGFATSWLCDRLIMVNPWAGIATSQRDLWRMDDPVGPDNDAHIIQAAKEVAASDGVMLVGWGAVSPPVAQLTAARERIAAVLRLVRAAGCWTCAVGVNLDGSPKHPLYARATSVPLIYPQSWMMP